MLEAPNRTELQAANRAASSICSSKALLGAVSYLEVRWRIWSLELEMKLSLSGGGAGNGAGGSIYLELHGAGGSIWSLEIDMELAELGARNGSMELEMELAELEVELATLIGARGSFGPAPFLAPRIEPHKQSFLNLGRAPIGV